MNVHNYLDEVLVLNAPTLINKDKFIEKYCSTEHEDLTLNNITKNIQNSNADIADELNAALANTGHTFRYKININKFNNYYSMWFKHLLKKAGLPHNNIIAHASLKKLQPKSHKVHTDSDNSFGNSHNVICRFLIPLSDGEPTCYFDKCMEDNKFYTRIGKHQFSVTCELNEIHNVDIKYLYDMKTKEPVEITEEYPDYDKLTHIKKSCLAGLKVHKIVNWKHGQIQLFPFNILHSSTDFDNIKEKWMINGVLYDQKIKR